MILILTEYNMKHVHQSMLLQNLKLWDLMHLFQKDMIYKVLHLKFPWMQIILLLVDFVKEHVIQIELKAIKQFCSNVRDRSRSPVKQIRKSKPVFHGKNSSAKSSPKSTILPARSEHLPSPISTSPGTVGNRTPTKGSSPTKVPTPLLLLVFHHQSLMFQRLLQIQN